MLSKQRILAAVIGLSMMALPATALAGHHERDWDGGHQWHDRHDNGNHNGWWKHGRGWNNHANWNNNPWYRHYEPDADDYRPAWTYRHESDEDDDYRPAWNYRQYEDDDNQGDDSEYYGPIPGGLNGMQQIQYLMQRRRNTYTLYNRALSRHDTGAARRLSASIHSLDARIKYLRRSNGYGTPYVYNPGYTPSAFGANPYYGNPYTPYGSNNPAVNALGALVGPMLGLPY